MTVHTTAQVAEILGCSEQHVRDLIAARRLRAADISTGRGRRPKWRITAAELERFLAESTVAKGR